MILDAETDEARAAASGRRFDIAICGAGPAGITLALALAESGLEVALLEGGGLEYLDKSQELYKGENGGLDYFDLDIVRVRQFGGSTNHWGGWIRALDGDDFGARRQVPMSGWPITKADLDVYADRARSILDVSQGEPVGNPDEPLGHTFEDMQSAGFIVTDAVRFAEKYVEDIRKSERIRLFLHCNVIDMTLADNLAAAQSVTCASYERPDRFTIGAERFVVAMGGIENPRFLLNAIRQISTGIGNERDLVGRYFAEHPDVWVGFYLVRPDLPSYPGPSFLVPDAQWTAMRRTLRYCLAVGEHKEESSWSMATLKARLEHWACKSDWTLSIVHLLRSGMKAGQALCTDDLETIDGLPGAGNLRIFTEQAPNAESRVMLAGSEDRFGLRRARLEWNLAPLDFHTMREAVRSFGEELAMADLGRVRMADWLRADEPEFPSTLTDRVAHHHHLCTTRMADDPQFGVVDRNCKVFGIANLYIAGSSNFTTGGYANPTFTIIQLTLRLADHLRAQAGR
ncbi:MAG: GMC family oxidoreductase [Geminicoccaceae bacterium]